MRDRRDERDGPNEVGTQSVHVAPFPPARVSRAAILLPADHEKVARPNSRAGEAILCLERIERDAKPF